MADQFGSPSGVLPRVRTLVVEDNPADADLVRERLGDAPGAVFEIEVAPTLAEAGKRLADAHFDVVVLDLNLPDSLGLETLVRFRDYSPVLPFVIVSGAIDADIRDRALAEGAQEVLAKHEVNSRLFAMSILNVFERHRSERRRRRVEKLLETSPDAMVVVDQKGNVQYVNEAAVQLFARTREDLRSESLSFSVREGEAVEVRVPRPRPEEPRVGQMRVVDFEWEGRPSTLASIRDITEQKKMEMQLMVSDRLASIGTLAAGVAHEINNPLSAVISNVALALQQLSEVGRTGSIPEDMREGLRDAHEAAERVRQIARDLKVLSRPDEEVQAPVDIHRVLESTLRMARGELRHRTKIERDYANPAPPAVHGNESRLGQVFLNLMVNAAQAMKDTPYAQNRLRIGSRVNDDGTVTVWVADSGPGIPLEVQDRLFAPFFTTKPAGEGTGLGLAISQRIVTQLGGDIRFESAQGRGTTFFVTLPPSKVQPVRKTVMTPVPLPPRRLVRICAIDDDPAIGRTLKRILSSEFDVFAFDQATQALTVLQEGGSFDVIFCDLMMPHMDGESFFSAVRELGRGFEHRIVFVTGGAFSPSAQLFLDSMAHRRLDKPFDLETLRQIISELTGPSAPPLQ